MTKTLLKIGLRSIHCLKNLLLFLVAFAYIGMELTMTSLAFAVKTTLDQQDTDMKDFEKAIWFDDNVSRAQVLLMDTGELLICFTDRHASMRFTLQPLDAELFAANILAAAMSSQIKSAA